MAEAAKKIIDWKEPDFIDINFGCPVKKVVSRNGGSSLLKDGPVLAQVAESSAKGVGSQVPVTAKIRIGWDQMMINAPEVCRILEECGIQTIAVHGRTRAQGYRGEADWDIIDECSQTVNIPIVGNGDINSGADVKRRRDTTGVSGIMIGRSACNTRGSSEMPSIFWRPVRNPRQFTSRRDGNSFSVMRECFLNGESSQTKNLLCNPFALGLWPIPEVSREEKRYAPAFQPLQPSVNLRILPQTILVDSRASTKNEKPA